MTTGRFTSEARREATRDGVPPIELLDGERTIDMLTVLELGLRPVMVYEIDEEFFDEFRSNQGALQQAAAVGQPSAAADRSELQANLVC